MSFSFFGKLSFLTFLICGGGKRSLCTDNFIDIEFECQSLLEGLGVWRERLQRGASFLAPLLIDR